jgi:HPt (histidine-containing phosphotransfer) domain-containing protein
MSTRKFQSVLCVDDDAGICGVVQATPAAAGQSTSAEKGKAAEQTPGGSVDDRFLQRTKTDIVRLREMIERSCQGGQSVLKEIEQLAHSIHGAGAMCGFLQVSAAGGVIERLVERVMASATTRTATIELAVRQQLYDCTEHLACEVEAAAHSAPSNAGMFQGRG